MKTDYKWQYDYVGGIPRVRIETADDIRHLPELDEKLWSVLSCPVQGLEIEEQTLRLLDYNNDGSIRINEVKRTAEYLGQVLSDLEIVLTEGETLPLQALNREDESGARLARLMEERGLTEVTPAVGDKMREEWEAKRDEMKEAALQGEADEMTEEMYAACLKVEQKIDDHFARCAMARYAENALDALDVQVADIQEMSSSALSIESEEMERLPLARVTKEATLDIESVNPAWKGRMESFFSEMRNERKSIDEASWAEVKSRMKRHKEWRDERAKAEQDVMERNEWLAEQKRDIDELWKVTMLRRDFNTLLRNYVTMKDFYDIERKAIYQCGELFIDQRCCKLCMEVSDMEISIKQGNDTGMFLIYCHCVSKTMNRQMNIVAALTAGGVRYVKEGKHALFYDRQGNDYDATVIHIIDNPISIGQAFYMPYRKFVEFIENQVGKLASEKNQKMLDKASAQVADSSEKVQEAAQMANATGERQMNEKKKQMFDIAKYCGIFAAIGMAIGYIGGFLTSLVKGFFALIWWQMPIAIVGVMLLISGPSMILAWLKLRKRDLAPLLNANGWAINTSIGVNIIFGHTLSTMANIPKIQLPKKIK